VVLAVASGFDRTSTGLTNHLSVAHEPVEDTLRPLAVRAALENRLDKFAMSDPKVVSIQIP
jgi:hypothetical protein